MNKKNQRKKNFANKMHREIFLLVFIAALLPSTIVAVSLYYLIFGVTAGELGIPEAIAYSIIPASQKVDVILLFAAPVSILIILLLAYKISHRMVGPFDRILKELDDCLEGSKGGRIIIRKGDKFQPLVDRINRLLERSGKR